MKKITKLLTAFATAVALILGASAFVSCSNSSDDSSSSTPAVAIDYEEALTDLMQEREGYKYISNAAGEGDDEAALKSVDNMSEVKDENSKLSATAKKYNEALDAVDKKVKEFVGEMSAAAENDDATGEDGDDEEEIDSEAMYKAVKPLRDAVISAYEKLSPKEKTVAKPEESGENPTDPDGNGDDDGNQNGGETGGTDGDNSDSSN